MPRTSREESSTGIYHIVCKGVNHESIFETDREKRRMRLILERKGTEYELEIYAYCIMSTHFHLLVRGKLCDISSYISRSEIVYAVHYNKKKGRNGHLFQNRFHSECVESERYFWNCINYIHNNPVKAQIVERPEEYGYSSYQEYLEKNAKVIHRKAIKTCERKFQTIEEFERFTRKNEQNSWFIGTDGEIAQQKNELILRELRKFDSLSVFENTRKKVWYSEYTKKISSDLKVSQIEVIEVIHQLRSGEKEECHAVENVSQF
ncbi:MAG: REP-associated tyrosine transposase [Roseburia sp.]